MMNAQALTARLGGKWHRSYGVAPCPVCQPERRRDQDALTLTDKAGKLLLHCKKSGCAYKGILRVVGLGAQPIYTPTAADIARNLGTFLGLRGGLSLLPLALLIIIAGAYLLRRPTNAAATASPPAHSTEGQTVAPIQH